MSPEDLSLLVTGRLDDWAKRCDERHQRLDSLMIERNERFERILTEIHNALYGNGKEGLADRVMRHTQAIKILQRDVQTLDSDLTNKFENLNTRVWKLALVMGGVIVLVNRTVSMIDFKSLLGL